METLQDNIWKDFFGESWGGGGYEIQTIMISCIYSMFKFEL